ncbi:MAG: DUF4921 family protein [Pirellulaceae bacterium]|nr:DUF4921 family protein [Pirellulaceae bacterium]
MADLRYDPINDLWVAVAEVRTERPNEYRPSAEVVPLERCPFCRGHETETPDPIAESTWDAATNVLQPVSDGNWAVRVIPNRFPAFDPHLGPVEPIAALDSDKPGIIVHPFRHARSLHSRQELVIESPRHVESYSQLNETERLASFFTYRQRLQHLRQNRQLKYVLLFKNCRPNAGASLAHIHSQLFGLDFVPSTVAARQRRLGRARATPSQWLLKQIADFELTQETRFVTQGQRWSMFCPYASRFGFQTWIVPRQNWGPLWEQDDAAIVELSRLVQTWTQAVEETIDRPAYNILFHNPLLRPTSLPGHCYIELFVRIGTMAGFEWGSNCWINTHSPESAANRLREKFKECDW